MFSFELVRYEIFLFFFVLYDCRLNIFGFWTVTHINTIGDETLDPNLDSYFSVFSYV